MHLCKTNMGVTIYAVDFSKLFQYLLIEPERKYGCQVYISNW